MNRERVLARDRGKIAGIILILALLALPTSAGLAASENLSADGPTPRNGTAAQIPTWEPPELSEWDNAPVTYDPTNGAVEQPRIPVCKTCPPDETDHEKRSDPNPCPQWPEATTVRIITTWPADSADTSECSGIMVDQSTVLTAAHCVFTHTPERCGPAASCWAQDLEIIVMYEDKQKESDFEQVLTWTAWTENKDFNYDLAGVKLENPLGDDVCWLGFGYNNDNQFFLNNIFTHSFFIGSARSTIADFSFSNPEEHRLFTNTTSDYGQAGAGAYWNGSSITVFSVLSHHHDLEGDTFTGHTRITYDKFFALRDWINGGIKDLNFSTYLPLITD